MDTGETDAITLALGKFFKESIADRAGISLSQLDEFVRIYEERRGRRTLGEQRSIVGNPAYLDAEIAEIRKQLLQ
jgi:hypothetical protein